MRTVVRVLVGGVRAIVARAVVIALRVGAAARVAVRLAVVVLCGGIRGMAERDEEDEDERTGRLRERGDVGRGEHGD